MNEIDVSQAKVIEEFYTGIQMFALIILVGITTMLIKEDKQFQMTILTILYASYVLVRFVVFVRNKYSLDKEIKHLSRGYTSIIDGLFIAAFIYINSSYIDTLTDLLYVFVVLQSIRYNAHKTYIFSTYASIIHITIIIMTNPENIISMQLFISISLYYVLNLLLSSALQQINHLQIQRKYFQNEIIKKNQILEKTAYKDYLTDISNYQSFYTYFNDLIKKSSKCKNPISLTLIDIDNFKQINDTYGHLAGDKILKELSAILKTNVRESDFLARYGGEEFAIIFPNTNLDCAARISERIREAVENNDFIVHDKVIKVTISLGTGMHISSWCETQQHDFIDQVDKLLYEAKEAGKNQVKYKKIKKFINEKNENNKGKQFEPKLVDEGQD